MRGSTPGRSRTLVHTATQASRQNQVSISTWGVCTKWPRGEDRQGGAMGRRRIEEFITIVFVWLNYDIYYVETCKQEHDTWNENDLEKLVWFVFSVRQMRRQCRSRQSLNFGWDKDNCTFHLSVMAPLPPPAAEEDRTTGKCICGATSYRITKLDERSPGQILQCHCR